MAPVRWVCRLGRQLVTASGPADAGPSYKGSGSAVTGHGGGTCRRGFSPDAVGMYGITTAGNGVGTR